MTACLTAAVLSRFVAGELPSSESRGVQDHCARCARCERLVRLLRAADGLAVPVVALVDEAIARLESEPLHRWFSLVTEPQFRTPGIARRLAELAASNVGVDHERAIGFATAAAEVAERVYAGAPSRDVADLCIDTWKTRSTALRSAGRFSEALDSLDRANRYLADSADAELQGAVLNLARGIILGEGHVWLPTEATRLLADAEAVFVRRGYEERVSQVITMRAVVLGQAGEHAEALPLFLSVLGRTEAGTADFADAAANVAWCSAYLGKLDDAERYLMMAERIDASMGRDILVARDLSIRGVILYRAGQYDESAAASLAAMEALFAQSAADDSALEAGLDAVRALTAAERIGEALPVLQRLTAASIRLDREQPSRRHFFTASAIAYLRELAEKEILTLDVAATVTRYVGELKGQNPPAFVPPLTPFAM